MIAPPPPSDAGIRRALLVFNKASRRAGAAMQEAIETLGRRHDLQIAVEDCPEGEQLSDMIIARRNAFDLVILGGGDGTMNAAARGLVETQLPLGILPMGTANDLARTLGIPEDLAQAAEIIADGHTRRIDLGNVNGKLFFNVASIGLSAQLAHDLTSDLKRRFGKFGYLIASIGVLLRAKPFRATIASTHGTSRALTLQIAIGNGLYYGGGMAIHSNAKIDDGALDLYSLEMRRAWKLALMARAFRYGEHGAWREVRVDNATTFEIRTRRRQPINADGEIVSHTPGVFRVHPGAMEVFAPASAPGLSPQDD